MNMNTEQISEIVVRYIEGAATDNELKVLEEWLARDERRKAMIERLQDRKNLADEYMRWDAVDVEGPRMRMKKASKPTGRPAVFISGIAAAALALVLLLRPALTSGTDETSPAPRPDYIESIVPGQPMATLTQSDGSSVDLKNEDILVKTSSKPAVSPDQGTNTREDLEAIACNVLSVPRGGEFHIVLEDSTEVWLNADSSLEYPESFSVDERRVSVSGEAYFKVHAEKDRPFYVCTEGQVVKVYGTEFGVNSYPEDNNVYTTLVSGKVGIFPEDLQSSMLFLSPDHQAIFSKTEESIQVEPVNSKIVTSWKDGMFVFEDQTLKQIMVQLSRWYDFDYEFADEEVGQIQFKGRIHRYSKFADLLEILEKAGGIHFASSDNKILISKTL